MSEAGVAPGTSPAAPVLTLNRADAVVSEDLARPEGEQSEGHADSRRLTWSLLSGIVALSFVARLVALRGHTVPRFYPDEYIYAAIGQSLARGQLLVRDTPARFPALLEPLLAAPLWGLFSLETAYRLVQVQNALAMSLAAVPVFYLARRVGLSPRYSLACAVFAVALPDLVFSAFTMADPIAYPLVMAAIASAVHALDTGSRRAQLLFVAFASLASFARVQYLALFIAFVGAAFMIERVRAVKKYRTTLLLFALPLAITAAVGFSRVLGYYSVIADLDLNGNVVRWYGIHALLLALVAGVALVPGAIVAVARPRGRIQTAFSSFAVSLTAILLLEAAVYAANGSPRFKERYVFMLLPLVPIAFGLYVKNGRPHPRFVTLAALVIVAAVARFPLSAYSTADGRSDSPFLSAVSLLDKEIGAASSSLVFAALATTAAAAGIFAAWRRGSSYVVAATVVIAALVSIGAVKADLRLNRLVEQELPPEKSWVDLHELGAVTAIQTPNSPRFILLLHLYWNPSIKHEVILPGALPTDAFRAPPIRVNLDGSLSGVSGPILFHDYGTTATFADADLIDRRRSFTLWRPRGQPRLRLLITGRYADGWAAQKGSIRVWSGRPGQSERFSFQISLPRTATEPTTMKIGPETVTIRPGDRRTFEYTVPPRRGLAISFSADKVTDRVDDRFLSVRMTDLRFGSQPAASSLADGVD